MEKNTPRFEREKETLQAMIRIYCRDWHHSRDVLCGDCAELQRYALSRLDHCTFGAGKPKCSDCPIHCYTPARREHIRTVMRHSGPKMMVQHPVLALGHVVDGVLHRAAKPARKAS
jgi:Nitrous oxide-stimulated promoter